MLKEMNQALDYIEAHLDQVIDQAEVARIAHCSEYHFRRLFSILSGYSLSEYIRNRRMTLAAMELKGTENKVIDVAIKYGYQSPDAFTRAFQHFHGVTPSEARKLDQQLTAFPRLSFQLIIRGGLEMKYQIIEKEAFVVAGVAFEVEISNNILTPSYEVMIDSINEEEMARFYQQSLESEPSGIVHVTSNQQESEDGVSTFTQHIGYITTDKPDPALSILEIPQGTWAVFDVVGDWEEIEKHWMQIYTEWLTSSHYEYDVRPELLASKEQVSQIWIPIK